MVGATSSAADVDDGYLLPDLVWCGLCGGLLEPALVRQDMRFYGCRSILCVRSLVSAETLETLVWQAFLYRFTDTTPELTAEERRQALVHALERVTVGADLGDVRYQWRDAP